jgi:Nucleotidyltransferase of unknown function (DUF6036)
VSTTGFDRDKIMELLTELGRRLSAKGVAGRLYVVGGAAMALEFDTRRTTRDIDAIFDPPTTVAREQNQRQRGSTQPGRLDQDHRPDHR